MGIEVFHHPQNPQILEWLTLLVGTQSLLVDTPKLCSHFQSPFFLSAPCDPEQCCWWRPKFHLQDLLPDIYHHHCFHPNCEKVNVKDKGKGRAGAFNVCENWSDSPSALHPAYFLLCKDDSITHLVWITMNVILYFADAELYFWISKKLAFFLFLFFFPKQGHV